MEENFTYSLTALISCLSCMLYEVNLLNDPSSSSSEVITSIYSPKSVGTSREDVINELKSILIQMEIRKFFDIKVGKRCKDEAFEWTYVITASIKGDTVAVPKESMDALIINRYRGRQTNSARLPPDYC